LDWISLYIFLASEAEERIDTLSPLFSYSLIIIHRTFSALETVLMLAVYSLQVNADLPSTPVLSGSTAIFVTSPSCVKSAYRLLRLLPKMAALSKARSSLDVNSPVGSPRKRI